MKVITIPCGTLKVRAEEMHNGLDAGRLPSAYQIDPEGNMRVAMNALLVDTGKQLVVFDPGCADFLPSRFVASYGLEIDEPFEQVLAEKGYEAAQVTDVVFTHLHFDHGSGAFARKPGMICKRFPNASYHVFKEHYEYARKPDKRESNSFILAFFRYLDRVDWLEDWRQEWMDLRVFNGHTRGMVVPVIQSDTGPVWYLTDLVPMESFMEREVSSGYDLDPELARREKGEFLDGLRERSILIFFHDPVKERVLYP